MCVEVIVCYIIDVFFETQCISSWFLHKIFPLTYPIAYSVLGTLGYLQK